ncbi:hypothetical protein M513_09448 [Trichuris suis]|uniref:Uncharacterized protein n=1 Tax=Trichuris suis TaxID=68888 RepID=A0A085LXC0_9BILA|nr:hypothetical protein M513_09448 [Trichuris suis]
MNSRKYDSNSLLWVPQRSLFRRFACAHRDSHSVQENNKVIVTAITVQPRASANPNFASASPPGASPPRLVAIRAPSDGHLRCAEAHLDALDDAVVLEDR